ncbi:MAG: cellulose biosynthesis cyclic di-GMP-binding regulatory protein BcsB, partial [Methylococcales bacterium]
SPPNKEDDSQLSMFVNDLFIKGFSLNKNGISGESDNDRVRVPLIDDLVFGEENRILVPGFRLSTRNRIQFEYSFNKPEGGDCRDLTADYMYGEVDGDSTIDLSGFYHYMPMPDLRSFSNLGFPFTRLADLADTGVILNKNASESEVETYLELLGSFGSSTGLSATKFTIFDSAPYNGIEDKDILVIGQLSTQIVQENDKNKLANVLVSEMKKAITQPIRNAENTEIFQPNYIKSERTVTSQIEFNNNSDNEVGALLSFESPWQKNRSVVALVASHPSSFKQIISTIMNRSQVVSGSVSLFRAGEVVNVQVGETYFIGYLPIYKLIWFELSDHPILVGLITFLMVILLITTLWRLFKYIAYKRLKTSR